GGHRVERGALRRGDDVLALAGGVAEVAKPAIEDRDMTGAQRVHRLVARRTKSGRRGRRGWCRARSCPIHWPHGWPEGRAASRQSGGDAAWGAYNDERTLLTAATPSASSASVMTSGGVKRSTRSPAAVRRTPASASFGRMSRTTYP